MGDPFGGWSTPSMRSDRDESSLLYRSNSFARPTGKSIYNQRKDYGETLLKPQRDFQHHVEHLLTVRLDGDLRSAGDCVARLRALEAQGRIWGQDLILQVKDEQLVLRDVESKEELDVYALSSVLGCSATSDIGSYSSVLTITVQSPPGTSVLLFQCDQTGAETLKNNLEKLVKQWKEEQRSHYGQRSSRPPSYVQSPSIASEQWEEPPEPNVRVSHQPGLDHSPMDTQNTPWTNSSGQVMSEVDRDVEVLNHVLSDLELFVDRLKAALGMASITDPKKKKKKMMKKKKKALPSRDEYTDFFQKVKYALNLLGRTHQHVREPDPRELLQLIFTALSFVLAHCSDPSLAPSVEAPLLVAEALELLEKNLDQDNYHTWKSLGIAWTRTRAKYPDSELVPRYIPVFSDGWLPPAMEQVQRGGDQDIPSPASASLSHIPHPSLSLHHAESLGTGRRDNPGQAAPSAGQGLVRVLYEFQSRNPQELSVRMGDTLQVLDQQRRWWLVQDDQGDKGFVPSNILEPLWGGHSQTSPPSLHPDSPPAEVTAWLQDKGFSRITVRCLGALRGEQLLQMSAAELRAVCPEEWRRLLFKLSSARAALGIGPRD